MALAEAVLEIAQDMEDESNSPELKMYAKQLRRAVKAAEGSAPAQQAPPMVSAFTQHVAEIEKAREEMREEKRRRQLEAEEGLGARVGTCVGGPADGLMVPLDSQMPVGAKTIVDGQVYRLMAGDKLEPIEGDSKK